jgi:hypothetical protein
MKNKDSYILYSIITIGLIFGFLKFENHYLLYASVLVLIFPIVLSKPANFISEYWRKFGLKLGQIQSTILLGIIYILVFTIIRFFKKNTTKYDLKNNVWIDSEHSNTDFTKQW